MAKKTYLYEVLIRGNPDGSIKGSHMVYMDRFTDDGTDELIVEREQPAQPIDLGVVESLLGKEMAGAAAQVASLSASNGDLAAKLAAMTAERDVLAGKIETVLTSIAATAESLAALAKPPA